MIKALQVLLELEGTRVRPAPRVVRVRLELLEPLDRTERPESLAKSVRRALRV